MNFGPQFFSHRESIRWSVKKEKTKITSKKSRSKESRKLARIMTEGISKNDWGNTYNITTFSDHINFPQVIFSVAISVLEPQYFFFCVQYSCSESNNFWKTAIMQSLLSIKGIKGNNAWSMTFKYALNHSCGYSINSAIQP